MCSRLTMTPYHPSNIHVPVSFFSLLCALKTSMPHNGGPWCPWEDEQGRRRKGGHSDSTWPFASLPPANVFLPPWVTSSTTSI